VKIGFGLGLSDYRFSGGGLDPDALAFITAEEAAGATFSPTQKTAINNLFLDLKGQGPNNSTTDFWTTNKVKRWWPFVGGVGAANAIDVRLNTGTWNGGWTHTADGAKGNASNTWFNSGLALQGEINQDWGFGYYGAEYTTGDWMCGVLDYSLLPIGAWWIRQITGPNTEYFNAGRGGTSSGTVVPNLSFNGARTCYGIGNDLGYRYNGTNFNFLGFGTPVGDTAVPLVFGNLRDNFGGLYGANDMEYRSMYITFGISVADSAILQTIDNAFQTALGRNTY